MKDVTKESPTPKSLNIGSQRIIRGIENQNNKIGAKKFTGGQTKDIGKGGLYQS